MSVLGIGRRSARPPYSTLWARLLAADATWSGLGIRSMGWKLPTIRGCGALRRSMDTQVCQGVGLAHETVSGAGWSGRRRRGARRRGGARPDSEAARLDAQLPADRPRPLLAGD